MRLGPPARSTKVGLRWAGIDFNLDHYKEGFDNKVEDLYTAYNGEPSKKPHGACNEAQLGLKLDLLVSLDFIKRCSVKEDMNKPNSRIWQVFTFQRYN